MTTKHNADVPEDADSSPGLQHVAELKKTVGPSQTQNGTPSWWWNENSCASTQLCVGYGWRTLTNHAHPRPAMGRMRLRRAIGWRISRSQALEEVIFGQNLIRKPRPLQVTGHEAPLRCKCVLHLQILPSFLEDAAVHFRPRRTVEHTGTRNPPQSTRFDRLLQAISSVIFHRSPAVHHFRNPRYKASNLPSYFLTAKLPPTADSLSALPQVLQRERCACQLQHGYTTSSVSPTCFVMRLLWSLLRSTCVRES